MNLRSHKSVSIERRIQGNNGVGVGGSGGGGSVGGGGGSRAETALQIML